MEPGLGTIFVVHFVLCLCQHWPWVGRGSAAAARRCHEPPLLLLKLLYMLHLAASDFTGVSVVTDLPKAGFGL